MVRRSRLFRIALLTALSAVVLAAMAPTITKVWARQAGPTQPDRVLICGADGVVSVPAHDVGVSVVFTSKEGDDKGAAQNFHERGCPYCGLAFSAFILDSELRFGPPRGEPLFYGPRVPPGPYEGWALIPSRAPPLTA